jgi:hypothetical protein
VVLAGGAVTAARRRASVIASTLTLRYTPPPSTVTLKLSKRWRPAPLGAYDHTPASPLVKALSVTGPITVLPFTSTLMAEPFARKASVYHVPRLKPEMVEVPNDVKLSTRHRLTVPLLSISAV